MKKFSKIFTFVFIFLITFSYQDNNNKNIKKEKLLFVWEHFRHGARDPYTQIDPQTWIDYIGVQWKSQGELNSLGMRMHYLLGKATRKKYNDFLSKSFNPNEIYILSTDTNRTIVSVMANLQGIYDNFTTPNLTVEQMNISRYNKFNYTYKKEIDKKIDEIKNSYIQNGIGINPIHIFSKVGLQFRLNGVDFCPGIQKYIEEAHNREESQRQLNEFTQKTNNTYGAQIFSFMNISAVERPRYLWEDGVLNYLLDTFIADYFSGRNLSHIEKTGINLEEFYQHALNYLRLEGYNVTYGIPRNDFAKITVSPMFRTIFNYMERRINLNENGKGDLIEPSSPKFVIYSGHDSTLSAVDVFLEDQFNITFDNLDYATSQVFELWKNESMYYVRYLVNQKIKAEYEFYSFKDEMNSKIFPKDEIEKICLGGEETSNEAIKEESIIQEENIFKKVFYVTVCITCVSLGLLISLIILDRKKQKSY